MGSMENNVYQKWRYFKNETLNIVVYGSAEYNKVMGILNLKW
jgi:hypothetical protein